MSNPDCIVRDGKFVEPCETLESVIDNNIGSFSKARCVTRWNFTNMTTRKPSKSFIGVRTKKHMKGMLFNYCPFCGVDISAPFQPCEEPEGHPALAQGGG